MSTLLLIEDFPADRELYRRYLLADTDNTYRVLEADNATAGLELCRTQAIDGVLLDYSLPDADGLEFIQSLHAQSNGNSPPVVMVTGVGDERVAVQAMKLGAEDYLVKRHLTPELLQLTMRSAIENTQLRLQLRDSEERYRTVVEDQTELICRFLPNGILTFVNPAYCRYFDLLPDKLIGQNFLSLIPERDRAAVQQRLARLRAATPETAVSTCEHPVPKPNGEIVWQEWTDRAIFDRQGQLVEFQAVGRDISKRKRIEAERSRLELELSQRAEAIQQLNRDLNDRVTELQTLIEIAPVGIAIATDPGCMQMQNNAYLRDLLGVSPGRNISKSAPAGEQPNFQVFQNGQEVAAENLPMQAAARLGVEVRDTEIEIRLPDGTVRQLLSYATPLHGDHNEVRGVVGAFLDITERKQTEVRLRQSEDRFRTIAQAVPSFLFEADREGANTWLSESWCQFTGQHPEQASGQGWIAAVHPEDRSAILEQWRRSLRDGRPLEIQQRLRRFDGQYRWMLVRAVPMRDEQGQVYRWVGSITDIDAIITAESALQQREAAIRQHFAELESIYATAPVGLCFQDTDLRYVRINDRLAEINGVPAADHLGRTIREVLPDLADTLEAIHQQVLNTGEPILGIEIQGTTSAQPGIERNWISSYYPLKDAEGQVLGVNVMVQDVTDLKQTEAALRESQAQFEAFMQYCPTAAYIKDEDGRYLYGNPLAQQIFDRPFAEWKGKTDFELFLPQEAQQWRNHDLTVLATNQPIEAIETQQQSDGEHTFLSIKFPIQLSPQRLVGGLSLDITDRIRTEQRLQESETQLRLGVQVAGIALAKVDYDANTVTLSPEAAALFGIPVDQLTATREHTYVCSRERLHAAFHPDDRDKLARLIEQVLDPAGDGWLAHEHRVLWQNGRVRWLNVRKQVFFDRSGETARPRDAILAAIDITDRKQSETALQESHEQLTNTLESITDAFISLDEAWHFTFVNPQAAKLLHKTSAELIGKNMWAEFPEGLGTPFEQAYRRAIDEQVTVQLEAFYPPLNAWLELRIYPTKSPTKSGLAVYFRDVTARKTAEAERDRLLQQEQAARAEAEAANRSKDDFVSLVAHELRSPLNAILGWAKLLQTRSFDAATTHKALETIARNTQAQAQLIDDLLDVSRMVRGTLPLEFAAVDLANVVEAAIETIRPTAEAKPLQLDTQLHSTAPIRGDFSRLQQVVLNLLTNAVKFTPAGGRVHVLLTHEASLVQMQISDTGKGIHPDFLPHIFERFRQDQQNTTAKQGLGLGLAIVKYIVEQHGGTITAHSRGEGQGTTFTVTLPLLGEVEGMGGWGDGEQGGWGARGMGSKGDIKPVRF